MKICLNPGHGGKDSGACGNGLLEKNVNLAVALKVQKKLEAVGQTVVMTRTNDTYMDLTAIANFANAAKADYFLSIHHNAGGGHGYDVIYALCGGKSKTVADAIATQFDAVGQRRHGVYSKAGSDGRDYYAVIRQTKMAANICEYGFIDTDDANHFNTDALQEVEAEAIFRGLCNGLCISIPTPAPVVTPKPVQVENPDFSIPTGANITPLSGGIGYIESHKDNHRVDIHLDRYTYITLQDGIVMAYARNKQAKQII